MHRFWSENWGGKAIAFLITGFAVALFYFDGCGHHRDNRFEHDLRLAIAGRPDTVSVNQQATTAGLTIRHLVEYQPTEVTPHLTDSLKYTRTVRLQPGTAERETLYTCTNADVIASMMVAIAGGRALPMDSVVTAGDSLIWRQPTVLQPLLQSRRPMPAVLADLHKLSDFGDYGGRFEQVIKNHPYEAAGNYFGRINTKTLPRDTNWPTPTGRLIFIWWTICSVVMFIGYFYQLDYPEQVLEDIHWFRPSTYVSFLSIAPASVVVLLIGGIVVPIRWLKSLLETDVRQIGRRAPEPPPPPQRRPEPPRFVDEPRREDLAYRGVPAPAESELLGNGTACYFLFGLSSQLIRLTGSGIAAESYRLPDGRVGIILAQSDLDRANQTMGLLISPSKTQATDKSTLVEILFDRDAAHRAAQHHTFQTHHAEVRGSYVELLSRRLRDELEVAESETRRVAERQQELFREATEMEMHRELLAARVKNIRDVMAKRTSPQWLGHEFDHLCAMSEVKYIDVEHDAVHVFTNMLYAEEERGSELTYYELGEFELVLNLDGTVLMKNLTNRRGGKDHPGLIDGAGCLGNVAMGMGIHIGRAQFTIAAQMCIAFLTRDIRGGYKHGGWKEVSREQALAATARHDADTDAGAATVPAFSA